MPSLLCLWKKKAFGKTKKLKKAKYIDWQL